MSATSTPISIRQSASKLWSLKKTSANKNKILYQDSFIRNGMLLVAALLGTLNLKARLINWHFLEPINQQWGADSLFCLWFRKVRKKVQSFKWLPRFLYRRKRHREAKRKLLAYKFVLNKIQGNAIYIILLRMFNFDIFVKVFTLRLSNIWKNYSFVLKKELRRFSRDNVALYNLLESLHFLFRYNFVHPIVRECADELEKTHKHRNTMNLLNNVLFVMTRLPGFPTKNINICLRGRPGKSSRTRTFYYIHPKKPATSSYKKHLTYAFYQSNARIGSFGVRITALH